LLRWFHDDARQQLSRAAASTTNRGEVFQPAIEILIGRTFATAGTVSWLAGTKTDRGSYTELEGTLQNESYTESLPVKWLYPKQRNGHAVVWLGDAGSRSMLSGDGTPLSAVRALLDSGALVVGADLFSPSADPHAPTRSVASPREFAGYTHGYNHSLFAQRTHDVLSIIGFLRNSPPNTIPTPSRVLVAAWGSAGPIALCARVIAGAAIDKLAVDTNGFRFARILDYRDPMFLPGGSKYLDLPGIIALNAPYPTWIAGEGRKPNTLGADFRELTPYEGQHEAKFLSAVEWLLR
jgi:hypothetical protein